MPFCRCYFLDDADHIKSAETIEAETIEEAIEKALAMLRERPQHRAVELWDGARRVYPAAKPEVPKAPGDG